MKLAGPQRIATAGIVWVCIGVMLAWRGWNHWTGHTIDESPVLWLALAAVIGGAKGWFVIRKSARRIRAKNAAAPEPRWIWEMYPTLLYILIPAMIGLGYLLRTTIGEDMPGLILAVYGGIGAALCVSAVGFFGKD